MCDIIVDWIMGYVDGPLTGMIGSFWAHCVVVVSSLVVLFIIAALEGEKEKE